MGRNLHMQRDTSVASDRSQVSAQRKLRKVISGFERLPVLDVSEVKACRCLVERISDPF